MRSATEIGLRFQEKLHLFYKVVGYHYDADFPEKADGLTKMTTGCVFPMIFAASKGKCYAVNSEVLGRPCSSFYLGFRKTIFDGIDRFLSHGPIEGREPERFVRTPELAADMIDSMTADPVEQGYAVFKPLENYSEKETPEVAIFFANPDQLSALVFLMYYDAPVYEDRVIARFASACSSVTTLPLHYARSGQDRAIWGGHDITCRTHIPQDIATFSLPYSTLAKLDEIADECFLQTESWRKVAKRISQ